MNKYKFIKYPDPENKEFDRATIEVTTEATTLTEILEDFENFLRACTFSVEEGSLIIDKEDNG